jgi:putative transcriptional regulator
MKNDRYFGTIEITLGDYIKKMGISKNKVAFRAELQRTQLNNYIDGKIQRLDMSVLSRLCYALDCELTDILRYVPSNTGGKTNE